MDKSGHGKLELKKRGLPALIQFSLPVSLLIFSALISTEVAAESVQAHQNSLVSANRKCISEASAKNTLTTLFKNFPSKESFLSFKRSDDYRFFAPTLAASQPFLEASPDQQLEWLAGYLPEAKLYYDDPNLRKWDIQYLAIFLDKNGQPDNTLGDPEERIYKQFPQKKECISGINVMSPDLTCYEKQQLRINFRFSISRKNGAILLERAGLSPLACKP